MSTPTTRTALLRITVAVFVLALVHPIVMPPAIAHAEPPIRATIDAALRHARLHGDPTRSLRRRARWAGLAPWLTVRVARDLDWTDGDATGEVDNGQAIDVRATWRLDRIVFDGSEPRIAALERAHARARREVARDVIRLYYRRQRLLADPGVDPLELAEVTAELDDVTGGWFARTLGATPPGPARAPPPSPVSPAPEG